MREARVTLTFQKHCLGHVRKYHWQQGKRRSYFLLPRNPAGKIVFMPSWWQAILRRAAEVLCRHQEAVKRVCFAPEIEGQPRSIPEHFYRRYIAERQFAKHEAFFPGDTITASCLVPAEISDSDLCELLTLAGKYFGISPARANEYGHFVVAEVCSSS